MYQNKIDDLLSISGTDIARCMKCGRCSASCKSGKSMDIQPHQFVSYAAKGRLDELLASESLWQCLSCFACVERCPRGVKPAALIEAARLMVIRRQSQEDGHLSPEDIPELLYPNTPQQLLVSAFRKYKRN